MMTVARLRSALRTATGRRRQFSVDFFETGIDQIVGDKKAFVNFDQNFLNSESIRLIEPVTLIIEVLEDTVFDDAVISRISELRSLGYKIALDDFEYSEA